MKKTICVATVLVLAFVLSAGAFAQGRAARAGSVEHVMVHGKSLEGNLEGDSPDRNVTVYLPPGYGTDPARRFPVIYFLHGYGAHSDEPIDLGKQIADKLSALQGFSEPIVVVPDAYTLHKGSMYSNSPTTGDWERFVAEDLVAYIDGHYRTLAKSISRGLAGQLMGGYGALRIGMKRPEVFSSLYVMSACCLAADNSKAESMLPVLPPQREFLNDAQLAAAAAWSPNPNNPPTFVDLPMKDGKTRPEVMAKWNANALLTMLGQYAPNLKKYYSIAIDVGTNDQFLTGNRQLHEAMAGLHIPHYYEEYDGDHTNKLAERVERNLLPFFSKSLAAPANPTSPAIQR